MSSLAAIDFPNKWKLRSECRPLGERLLKLENLPHCCVVAKHQARKPKEMGERDRTYSIRSRSKAGNQSGGVQRLPAHPLLPLPTFASRLEYNRAAKRDHANGRI